MATRCSFRRSLAVGQPLILGNWHCSQPSRNKSDPVEPLFVRSLVTLSSRHAASEMHKAFVRSCGAHGTQAPIARSRVYPRKPGLRILRTGAVGIFGPQALAWKRFCIGCVHLNLQSRFLNSFSSRCTWPGATSAIADPCPRSRQTQEVPQPAALGSRSICPAASRIVR